MTNLNLLGLKTGDLITQDILSKIDNNTTAIQTAIDDNSNKIGVLTSF